MKKLPKRYERFIFALLMSFGTALIVSGAITFLHNSPAAIFIKIWLSSFLTAWPMVFLSISLIAPQINKLIKILVESN
jgi:hypothetical protein